MKKNFGLALIIAFLYFVLTGCGEISPPNTEATPIPTVTQTTPQISPAATPVHNVVTSTADSGPGTLRQALTNLPGGAIITFDPAVFPPESPAVIMVLSPLPVLLQGNLTIDASNAGVILDGSQAGGEWTAGIEINSEKNIIWGLQIIHFTGPGILISSRSSFNTIGGDRNTGLGLTGQGNLIGENKAGVAIYGSDDVITGNLIGTDTSISGKMGNKAPGLFLDENASRNVIGPDNVIAYNGSGNDGGIEIRSRNANGNAITANSIHDNSYLGIFYSFSDATVNNNVFYPSIPEIIDIDLAFGMVTGTACPNCVVEIFSTHISDGEIFEGTTTSDQNGDFSFNKGEKLTGPGITATTRSADSNTSAFSEPSFQVFIVVSNTNDSGTGTLREALTGALRGTVITFDLNVFPPEEPARIILLKPLPGLRQGKIIIDASNAGVILDGRQAEGNWPNGIEISSDKNVIKGLQIINFRGPGIQLNQTAVFNKIGGDRNIGLGPVGEGNLISGNGVGIVITGSDNVIIGNLIGTDLTGTEKKGNLDGGINIWESASRNVIGPNNIIAFNPRGAGVGIMDVAAQVNIITTNSLHDNSVPGIMYGICEKSMIAYPPLGVITKIDQATGAVSGVSCPNCTVEIYNSTYKFQNIHSGDGLTYEGTTQANENGLFAFEKGVSLSSPLLTIVSRSPQNVTGEFSEPTHENPEFPSLQERNDNPNFPIQLKSGVTLSNDWIGLEIGKHRLKDYQGILDNLVFGLGAKNVTLGYSEIEPSTIIREVKVPIDWVESEFNIDPEFDAFVTGLAERGVKVNYVLTFWDKANHPKGWQPETPRFKTQGEIDQYLEYVSFIVTHFKGRVDSYQIWNEPNNDLTLQWIQVNDYINIVRQTSQAIHEIDPKAKIAVGSIVLQKNEDRDYLFRILKSDVMPMVDIITWHPTIDGLLSSAYSREYYDEYPSIVQQIEETAEENGFDGEFFAGELAYALPDDYWCELGRFVEHIFAAGKNQAREVIMNIGNGVGVRVNGISSLRRESFSLTRNLSSLLAGAEPEKINMKIDAYTDEIQTYSFSLPGGDKLVALWLITPIVPYSNPTQKAKLTLYGLESEKVIGVDVLKNYEQQLNTTLVDGNLIIEKLLIKDYPIILILKGVKASE